MRIDTESVKGFLDAVAARTPTPGGGAVASVTAALAAALGQMVLNFSLGKKPLAPHDSQHRTALEHLKTLASRAMDLARADAEAYARLNELWKLDKDDPRRHREFSAAVDAAIAAPKAVMDAALDMLETLQSLCGTTNAMLNSDLAIAAVLADAAVRSGAWNVRINVPLIENANRRHDLTVWVNANVEQARTVCAGIERQCAVA